MVVTVLCVETGVVDPLSGCRFVPVRPEGLGAALLRRPLPGAVLLGEGARGRVRPVALATCPDLPVLAVWGAMEVGVHEEWREWKGFRWVSPARWRERLAEVLSRAQRPVVDEAGWFPRGTRREGVDLLRMVPDLPVLDRESWAAAAGCGITKLNASCARFFEVPPGRVIERYTVEAVRQVHRDGGAEEAAALAVGYENKNNVRRLFRRRGLAYPWGNGGRGALSSGRRAKGEGPRAKGQGRRGMTPLLGERIDNETNGWTMARTK
jgi:AraC-like DNA-binding protein